MSLHLLTKTMMVILLMTIIAFATVKKGPYLIYEGNPKSMMVLWQMDSSVKCTILWGVDKKYSSGNAQTAEYNTSTHQHKYAISGLSPATRYYYQIKDVGSGSFTTAPDSAATKVKFFVYGDTRSHPIDNDSVCGQMVNTYTNDLAFQTIVFHTGDWVSADAETNWSSEWFNYTCIHMMKIQANLPINGCIGNHEGSGKYFKEYYPYPTGSKKFYWSFNYGPVHFAIVNDVSESFSPGSAQYKWLNNDLVSTTRPWKILLFHEPGWSAGTHSDNTDVQKYIQPLCTKYGVDIVVCGHNHSYVRCLVDNIPHITTGGGGAELYPVNTTNQNVITAHSVHHHLEISIDSKLMTVIARQSSGAVIDSFQVSHLSSKNQPEHQ